MRNYSIFGVFLLLTGGISSERNRTRNRKRDKSDVTGDIIETDGVSSSGISSGISSGGSIRYIEVCSMRKTGIIVAIVHIT